MDDFGGGDEGFDDASIDVSDVDAVSIDGIDSGIEDAGSIPELDVDAFEPGDVTESEVPDIEEPVEIEALEPDITELETFDEPEMPAAGDIDEPDIPELEDDIAETTEPPDAPQDWGEGEAITIDHGDTGAEIDETPQSEADLPDADIPVLEDGDTIEINHDDPTDEITEVPQEVASDVVPEELGELELENTDMAAEASGELETSEADIPVLEESDADSIEMPDHGDVPFDTSVFSDNEIPNLEDDAPFVQDEADVVGENLNAEEEAPVDLLSGPIEHPDELSHVTPDLTPQDIQEANDALQKEMEEDIAALDNKFVEQTDAPYIGEEFHDELPTVAQADIAGLEENVAETGDTEDKDEPASLEDIGGWINDINPDYDPFDLSSAYDNNCGSCAFAVEQQLEGNTDAVASSENIGTIEEMNALTGKEQIAMSPDEIRDHLIEQGPGSHGIVGIDRVDQAGHWFNAYYDGEQVVTLDGQTGVVQEWPPDYGDVTNWDFSMEKKEV